MTSKGSLQLCTSLALGRSCPEGWAELGHVEGREMGFPGMGSWVVGDSQSRQGLVTYGDTEGTD